MQFIEADVVVDVVVVVDAAVVVDVVVVVVRPQGVPPVNTPFPLVIKNQVMPSE